MGSNQRKVEEFQRAMGHGVASTPGFPGSQVERLRYNLIEEELFEFADALEDKDLVEVADALADLLYVTYGTAAEFGIDLDEVFDEVHRSNMTKLDENGEPVPHPTIPGKSGKSHLYEPPRIAEILESQTLRKSTVV